MPLALERTVFFAIFLFSFCTLQGWALCIGHGNIFKWAKPRYCYIPTKAWAENLHGALGRAGVNLMVQKVARPSRFQHKLKIQSVGKDVAVLRDAWCVAAAETLRDWHSLKSKCFLWENSCLCRDKKHLRVKPKGCKIRGSPRECPSIPLMGIGVGEIPPGMLQRQERNSSLISLK